MSDLHREALRVLDELPAAFVRVHMETSGPRRKKGAGVRTSGGTRDWCPINVEADQLKHKMRVAVLLVHRRVAGVFGELGANGFNEAVDDLRRWSGFWTRMTDAPEMIDELSKVLRRANQMTGRSEAPTQLPQTVCPFCLTVGGMRLYDGTGEDERYGCEKCATSWTPGQYAAAVTDAIARATAA